MNFNDGYLCLNCKSTNTQYLYSTSTLMYCVGSDMNSHTNYYHCNCCGAEFSITKRGDEITSTFMKYEPISNKIEENKLAIDIQPTYLATKEIRDKYRQEWLEEQIRELQDKLNQERLKNGRLT